MNKVIFLVDMNAFFVSCEATRNPSLKTVPAAVAGDPKKRSGIILTANYEARKYGVRTAMTIYQAMQLCPGILLIPPDRELYEKKSNEVMEIVSQFTPVVQQNSIDEAWLDMTGCESLFGQPAEEARKIQEKINDETGLWCSIGISENKFLSKMAADMKKPQGITELWLSEVPEKLWPLPVGQLYGIGKQTVNKLHSLGLISIGDLAHFGKDILELRFGKFGSEIYQLANGRDLSPVIPNKQGAMKSIGRSTTMPQDITDLTVAKAMLYELAEEVGRDARAHGKKGSTVQITLKYTDFSTITRQKTVPSTNLTKRIANAACELLQKNWTNRAVRLLGLSISEFDTIAESAQLSFFPKQDNEETEKEEKLEHIIDSIRSKYGNDIVKKASILKKLK